jgi:hypothetical protein
VLPALVVPISTPSNEAPDSSDPAALHDIAEVQFTPERIVDLLGRVCGDHSAPAFDTPKTTPVIPWTVAASPTASQLDEVRHETAVSATLPVGVLSRCQEFPPLTVANASPRPTISQTSDEKHETPYNLLTCFGSVRLDQGYSTCRW